MSISKKSVKSRPKRINQMYFQKVESQFCESEPQVRKSVTGPIRRKSPVIEQILFHDILVASMVYNADNRFLRNAALSI